MHIEDYLKEAETRNPRLFQAAKIQLTPQALRDVMRHAYAAGELAQAAKLREATDAGMPDFMRGMFGGK